MNNLNKKIIILTGALGLLGKSIAESLAKNHAKVLMLDIKNRNEIKKIKDLENIKKNLFYFKCDVTKINHLKKIEKKISHNFNRIDVLINAAAVTDAVENRTNPKSSMFENFSLKDWNKSIVGNLNSMFLCSQIFGKKMLKQEKSSIINIASTMVSLALTKKFISIKSPYKHFIRIPPIQLQKEL